MKPESCSEIARNTRTVPNERAALSRRGFLKRSAAVAFPLIVPAAVLGRDGHTAPSERIVMASIGVGGQGMHNTRAFLGMPDVQYAGVCDVDREHCIEAQHLVNEHYAARRSAGTYQGCAAYGDFREVLARDDIDAVMIATPDHWHAINSIAAARAGKDIYCEKPLANSIPEGRAVVDAARRYQRVFQTGSHERSRDNARYACELARNGRIGKLHTIRAQMPVEHIYGETYPEMPVPDHFDYNFWLGPARDAPYTEMRCHFYFRYILDYSGGEMTDRGAHIIDLGQLGNATDDTTPITVEGRGVFPKEGLFDTAIAYDFTFEYANGVRLIGNQAGPRGIRFEGDAGWIFIHIHGGTLEADPPSLLREVIGPNELHLGRSRGHFHDFIECVKSRGETKAPVEVGHHTSVMCHMANIAMLLDKKLHWDPVRERFEEEEANRMMQPSMRAPWALA